MLLYIHIPFCASKCGYCAFNSYVDSEHFDAYVNALCVDIEETLRANVYPLDSVFFGGGTPNLLPARYYEKIFESIHAHGRLNKECEISLEANVNLIDLAWCKTLLDLGANRLSVGVQSFCEEKLAFLERDHRVSDVAHAFEIAHNAGFHNLSCDLITNTPLDSISLIESELHNAMKLGISHLSLYALSIDKGSRFAAKYRNEDCLSQDFCFYAREILHTHGFMQYEVSNYAYNGMQCRHNLGYWQGREYLGCGAGAVGRVGERRFKPHTHLQSYIANPLHKSIEVLSWRDLYLEGLMLGLRCEVGADMECVRGILGQQCEWAIRLLLEGGKAHIAHREGREFLKANELFLSDEIALWIIARGE